eukprot:TRINITY_DN5510_c0_g1_i1.p1 TRINITY_DN5510_c0_g1~~TRINITY_DN5510_c0_g1_i1.p1  ORF type:complete len:585 (+),score=149.34 TRINITY_DN5510_c0_g1_i1:85-1755(+)
MALPQHGGAMLFPEVCKATAGQDAFAQSPIYVPASTDKRPVNGNENPLASAPDRYRTFGPGPDADPVKAPPMLAGPGPPGCGDLCGAAGVAGTGGMFDPRLLGKGAGRGAMPPQQQQPRSAEALGFAPSRPTLELRACGVHENVPRDYLAFEPPKTGGQRTKDAYSWCFLDRDLPDNVETQCTERLCKHAHIRPDKRQEVRQLIADKLGHPWPLKDHTVCVNEVPKEEEQREEIVTYAEQQCGKVVRRHMISDSKMLIEFFQPQIAECFIDHCGRYGKYKVTRSMGPINVSRDTKHYGGMRREPDPTEEGPPPLEEDNDFPDNAYPGMSRELYLSSVPMQWDEPEVKAFLRSCLPPSTNPDPVQHVTILKRDGARDKRALAMMVSCEAAEKARSLSSKEILPGRRVRVDYKRPTHGAPQPAVAPYAPPALVGHEDRVHSRSPPAAPCRHGGAHDAGGRHQECAASTAPAGTDAGLAPIPAGTWPMQRDFAQYMQKCSVPGSRARELAAALDALGVTCAEDLKEVILTDIGELDKKLEEAGAQPVLFMEKKKLARFA